MAKAKRKPRQRQTFEAIPLDGPTEAQRANGHYERVDMIHADRAERVTVHINRGGTPVMRWHNANRLSDRQLSAIEWCQRLWALAGMGASVTAQYGERIGGNVSSELRAIKVLAANEDLGRFQGYVSRNAWTVFENVCRFNMAAGVAGSELGYGNRSAEVRAHTLVCEVADQIVAREKL